MCSSTRQQHSNQHSSGSAHSSTSSQFCDPHNMMWNGSTWIASNPHQQQQHNMAYSSHHQQQQQQQQQQHQYHQPNVSYPTSVTQQPAATTSQAENARLVRLYTDYYHQWTARHEEFNQIKSRNGGNLTPEQTSETEWAKYYADLSSRAAHYFHNNPTAITAAGGMALPSAPPPKVPPQYQQPQQQRQHHHQYDEQQVVVSNPFSAAAWKQQPQQQPASTKAAAAAAVAGTNNSASTTDGMKRYVDRCLQHYGATAAATGGTQAYGAAAGGDIKAAVMKQVQVMLQEEVRNGTLHTVNWDTKPILTLPTNLTASSSSSPAMLRNIATSLSQGSGDNGTVERTSRWSTSPTKASPYSGAANHTANDKDTSYYGPSSSSSSGASANGSAAAATALGEYNTMNGMKPTGGGFGNQSKNQSYKRKQPYSTNDSPDNGGSYYGPASSFENPNTSQFDTGTSEEFITLPSYHKAIVKKKKNADSAAAAGAGFNQTNSALSNRANRFSGKGGMHDAAASTQNAKTKNDSGEWDKYMGKGTIGGGSKKLDETDYENMTIRGTCTTLEKAYLRLTAPPRPELVRPQPILEQHLANLRRERQLGAGDDATVSRHDYLWFCSQLKAVRQDCTVQRIQNAFAVEVYEMHAKIALEEDDLNEYNQCQTQLKELYALLSSQSLSNNQAAVGRGDQVSDETRALRNCNEFLAYRLVYFVFLTMESQKYDGGSSDMFKVMLSLSHQQRQDPLIQHALKVREACCAGILDYHLFFRLRAECMTKTTSTDKTTNDTATTASVTTATVSNSHLIYLLDRIVPSMRQKALLIICKGYRPSPVAVDFVLRELGFTDATTANSAATETLEAGRAWLASCGCVFLDDGLELNTKDSAIVESVDTDKQSLI